MQHFLFIHTLYKSTSALINILIVLVELLMSENESVSTKYIYAITIYQRDMGIKQILRLPSSYTPNNDRPPSTFIPF